MHRTGTSVRGWCSSTAKLISLMLQYGIPLSEMVEALVGQCTEPFGPSPVTGHPVITESVGVLDAVLRSLALDYLAAEKPQQDAVVKFFTIMQDLEAAEIYDLVGEDTLDAFLEKFY